MSTHAVSTDLTVRLLVFLPFLGFLGANEIYVLVHWCVRLEACIEDDLDKARPQMAPDATYVMTERTEDELLTLQEPMPSPASPLELARYSFFQFSSCCLYF